MAKGLFLCKRLRADIQTTIAFLTTQVREPDKDDWKKLKRLVQYLHATKILKTILRAKEEIIIHWYIDAAYAVHADCKSQTGAAMSMGKGTIINLSTKQKLNTKSSTESELVAVDDASYLVIWTRNFLLAQDYSIEDNIVYQDNQSAILLEKNGIKSTGKRSKHINIQYFLSKTDMTVRN